MIGPRVLRGCEVEPLFRPAEQAEHRTLGIDADQHILAVGHLHRTHDDLAAGALHPLGHGMFRRWFPVATISLALALSMSRSAYIGLAVSLLVLLWGWPPALRWRIGGAFLAVGTLLALGVPHLFSSVRSMFVTAKDDNTLVVTLNKSVPYFVRATAHATLFPIPQAVVEKFGNDWTKPENIVGNGAYVLAENKPGERVTLKRNPKYWDNAKTVLETLNFLTINDENQGVTRYLSGEVDQTDVAAGQYPSMKQQYPNEAHSVPQLCTYYFDINMTDKQPVEALKDVRVREAISMAIDRDVIVNNVLQGGQIPAYFFTPPATADFKAPDVDMAKMTQADRDAKAKQLLTDAGYGPDKPVEFTYIYNTSEAHKKIATVVSQMLKEKLGINMQLQDMEFATLLDKRHQRDFAVARDAWCGDYNEASTFEGLMDSTSSQNNSGYSNADVDKWLKESATSEDPNQQYLQIETQVAKDLPIIPIYFYTKVFLQKTTVGGWPYDNVEQVWYGKDLYKTEG